MINKIEIDVLTPAKRAILCKPLIEIIKKFYEDPKNEKAYQDWLKRRKYENSKNSF